MVVNMHDAILHYKLKCWGESLGKSLPNHKFIGRSLASHLTFSYLTSAKVVYNACKQVQLYFFFNF